MKSQCRKRTDQGGYALLLALVFLTAGLLMLGGMAQWTSNSAAITARNNSYSSTIAAAEAATEVVIAQMDRDFLHQALTTNVANYRVLLPTTYVPSGWAAAYQYKDGHGVANQSDVVCSSWQIWTNMDSEFTGLYGLANAFQVTSYAKQAGTNFPISVGVSQSVQLSTIPVFQFALFSSLDLEINPGQNMRITGMTHANANLYVAPPATLEFVGAVGAVGHIYTNRSPSDPTGGSKTAPIYDSTHVEMVSSLTLPIGIDNTPTNLVKILDQPPFGEDPHSQLGEQRFYNKADLLVIATNNTVIVKYNANEDGTSFSDVPTNTLASATNSGYSFVKTNISFYDYREAKQVMGTEIDVGAFTNWLAGSGASFNSRAQTDLGHGINSIYVNDARTSSGKLTAVRLTNGRYLPAAGLTVATPQPLYVRGDFNAPSVTVGSTNTSLTKPSSLASDAITILSGNWNDSWNSSTNLSSRGAANTTVNSAFLAGIVPSVTVGGTGHYSGGAENFPRFLESWSSSTLTYNGSMVMMYPSRYATNFWISPGTYYNAPTRSWAFDLNFMDPTRLPPCTPQVRKLQRRSWAVVAGTGN